MNDNFQKFALFVAVIAIVAISGITHPSFFISGNGATADAGGTSSNRSGTVNGVPILVLPSLSANIGGQTQAQTSGVASGTGGIGTSEAPGASSTFIRAANTRPPNVGASAELVADLQTGDTFLNMNAAERWPMASVSKLMTAVAATDLLDPNQHITITSQMTAADPTENILHVGDTYTVSDLLRVMLLPSNNVAAEALAQFYGRAAFLAAMNAKAQAWGMASTYYDDPSGLSAANESSADDLLKLAQNIYAQYPSVLAITREPQATVENLATGQPVVVKSINQFAGNADFIGGKTGYTDQADGNLLSLFSYEGRLIFIMVLGVDDGVRFDATQELYNWLKTDFK